MARSLLLSALLPPGLSRECPDLVSGERLPAGLLGARGRQVDRDATTATIFPWGESSTMPAFPGKDWSE